MERETKEITIAEHTFQVKAYATALEANTIQQAYFKGSKVEIVGEQPKISEFNPGVQFEVEKELVKQMVVSMEGNVEGIIDRALSLPSDVWKELVAELDALVSKKKK